MAWARQSRCRLLAVAKLNESCGEIGLREVRCCFANARRAAPMTVADSDQAKETESALGAMIRQPDSRAILSKSLR
jgi:hypothetical protein